MKLHPPLRTSLLWLVSCTPSHQLSQVVRSQQHQKQKPNMGNKTNLSFCSFQGFKKTPKDMCVQTSPIISAVSDPWHLQRLCSLRAEPSSVHPLLHPQETGMNYLFRTWKHQESTVERPSVRKNNFILETLQNKPEQVKRWRNVWNNLKI